MTAAELQLVAGWLNRLPFVRWDRFVDADNFQVYGWIDRADGRRPAFILLDFGDVVDHAPGFTTSSDERSAEVAVLLYGDTGDHVPCQRVDDVFGALVPKHTTTARRASGPEDGSPTRRAEPSDV